MNIIYPSFTTSTTYIYFSWVSAFILVFGCCVWLCQSACQYQYQPSPSLLIQQTQRATESGEPQFWYLHRLQFLGSLTHFVGIHTSMYVVYVSMDAGSSPTEVRMMRYDFDSSAVSQFGPITLLFHYFKIVLSFIYNYICIYRNYAICYSSTAFSIT